ncbi:MAG: sn-glycerol-3-phosphate import ATP-binding protein UgpC [Betaproteobacteria bacterium]
MARVELRGITKSFGDVKVIHGIDCAIEDGEFVVILGPSGCGKSTLLRIVAGLERAGSGDVRIGAERVNDVEPKDRNIAMVFQNYALYPHMSVYDNMAYGLKIRGTDKAETDRRVQEAARMLELTALLARKPRQLSGGQRQRVAMGRAIVRQPQVFLFDEPLSNLDAKLRVQMRLELQKLHRRLGVTSLYVTHDQVEAMTLGSRIIVMNSGRAEQIGTPAEVYHQPATLFVAGFIGSPPMNLLPGTVSADGSALSADGLAVQLPVPVPALAGRQVVLGLRPEQLQLGGDALQVDVEMVESLGADHLIHARAGRCDLVVRVGDAPMPAAGARIGLGFATGAVHWFDPVSAQRITPD